MNAALLLLIDSIKYYRVFFIMYSIRIIVTWIIVHYMSTVSDENVNFFLWEVLEIWKNRMTERASCRLSFVFISAGSITFKYLDHRWTECMKIRCFCACVSKKEAEEVRNTYLHQLKCTPKICSNKTSFALVTLNQLFLCLKRQNFN